MYFFKLDRLWPASGCGWVRWAFALRAQSALTCILMLLSFDLDTHSCLHMITKIGFMTIDYLKD